MRAALLLAVVLVAACASVQEQLDEVKSAWHGATYDEVVKRWGPPARGEKLTETRQVHTWISKEPPVSAGGPQVGVGVFGGSGGGGGIGVGVGFPLGGSYGSPSACERTLTFENGVVVDQSWIGEPSYCRYFRRNP